MNTWTSRNDRLRILTGLRNRLIRSYDGPSWWWKPFELWDAFYEACQW